MAENDKKIDSAAVADKISGWLAEAIAARGQASLVVCGGTSPLDIFTHLAKKDLDWQAVQITLVDDRLVDPDHPDSNIKLVTDRLLCEKASSAQFISLPELDASQFLPFDVVLLGMGPDGHFASLFPDMLDNADAFSLSAPPQILTTGPKGNPLVSRISMNLSMILDCRHLILLVKGEEKAALIKEIQSQVPSAPHRYPVGVLLSQSKKAVQLCYLSAPEK